MTQQDHPIQKLHIRLIKPIITNFEDTLEEPDKLQSFDLMQGFPFEGRLYLAKPIIGSPPWLEFVQTGIEDTIRRLTNRSNAAILFIRSVHHIFAITFGFGRHQLRENVLIPDFGIRTALNSVEHSSLRSMDSLTIEDQTRITRSQVSRASSIHAFGLDVGRDILRAVTGKPRSDVPLYSISGSETTLSIGVRSDFNNLGQVCANLLRLYQSRTYLEHFSWIDNVSRVRDADLITRLDNDLLNDLESSDHARAYLSPPELIDWEDIRGFNYTHNRTTIESEMKLTSYLRNKHHASPTIEDLQSDKVFIFGLDDDKAIDQWPLYKCIVYETSFRKNTYVLTSGTWYEIDPEFARRIQRKLTAIQPSDIQLPAATTHAGHTEAEGDYNKRVAKSTRTLALMDKRLAACASAGSSIEFCDLFSTSRHIIHVKHYKGGSSALSHLFAQARVSAEALVSDDQFRNEVRNHLSDVGSRWPGLIPVQRPEASEYKIVIAIIGLPGGRLSPHLPFFSQINLLRTYESLTSLGFQVNTLRIPLSP
jgi:uncharacterized protein (TIGR04141 family)